jgi:hypothetical protein
MFASAILAIKKAFAQAQISQVYYLFDWDFDGVADYTSERVNYGISVSASNTWTTVSVISLMAKWRPLPVGTKKC